MDAGAAAKKKAFLISQKGLFIKFFILFYDQ
jgi:hypothetical protein